MQSHANVIEFSKPRSKDADGPCFIAWCWDRDAITIQVEGFDADNVDGETLLTFSPEVGVEIGEPTVLALAGEPSMPRFKGTFDEQRDFFIKEWSSRAEQNERLAIFDDEGLAGLARLPELPEPPLPEIDEVATAHANEVLRVARERVRQIGETTNLTLADCMEIAEQVEAEMANG
jgi:hypothetical protein